MEVQIIKDEKNHLVVEMNNQTIAELLRVYMNKDESVEMAVWKKEHPNKPVVIEVKTKGKVARKVLEDAAADIAKDTEKISEDFKKSLK
jgi:DNA-directed RNA polymerase subunit L